MSKKRILIIHPSLGSGGAEKIIAFVSNCLIKEYSVTLLLLQKNRRTLPVDANIAVIETECYSTLPIISKQVIRGFKDTNKLISEIKYQVKSVKPDLLICFDLRVLLASRIAMANKSNQILFSERADPYENPRYWQFLLRRIYKKIGYVVFQTKEARNYYGGIVDSKSTVIPNPALSRNLETSSLNIVNRESYIFTAGRFQHRKGFDILIQAFAEMIKFEAKYRLKIYGEGEEKESLNKLVLENGIEDKVEILPPVSGVIEKNNNAELFVLPSRSEGIPNIMIEAMMAEIPCIASDCSPGGAKLLSENGQVCLLANNDDYKSLAEKLVYAARNKSNMENMAKKAKKSLSRFDAEKIAGEWRNVVKEIIG
ncbi:glycosyltransferase [Vallitalea okinawensis]|uniref:glycosyltransferase n=1 Tax=Vallitalea okinawensis TaxID=2078660 RepID=UPI000CFC3546|nr:glycosyltransferase [Vallitalea okinawensis]